MGFDDTPSIAGEFNDASLIYQGRPQNNQDNIPVGPDGRVQVGGAQFIQEILKGKRGVIFGAAHDDHPTIKQWQADPVLIQTLARNGVRKDYPEMSPHEAYGGPEGNTGMMNLYQEFKRQVQSAGVSFSLAMERIDEVAAELEMPKEIQLFIEREFYKEQSGIKTIPVDANNKTKGSPLDVAEERSVVNEYVAGEITNDLRPSEKFVANWGTKHVGLSTALKMAEYIRMTHIYDDVEALPDGYQPKDLDTHLEEAYGEGQIATVAIFETQAELNAYINDTLYNRISDPAEYVILTTDGTFGNEVIYDTKILGQHLEHQYRQEQEERMRIYMKDMPQIQQDAIPTNLPPNHPGRNNGGGGF